jgi:hypothetical protein
MASAAIIETLATAGADLYSLTDAGLTPLSDAVKNNNTLAVMALLGEIQDQHFGRSLLGCHTHEYAVAV